MRIISTLILMFLLSCSVKIYDFKKASVFPVACAYKLGRGFNAKHKGLDIITKRGCPVVSVLNGGVYFTGYVRGYGKTVVVDHGDILTLYAHLDKILVRRGQKVNFGDTIGRVGMSGKASSYHLHFEALKKGKSYFLRSDRIDPKIILGDLIDFD